MEKDDTLPRSRLSKVTKVIKQYLFFSKKKVLNPIGKFIQLLPRIIFKLVGSLGKQVTQLGKAWEMGYYSSQEA
ncbi:hypothetical protein BV53_04755 [Candidatus Synechococcus spongiarum LMB bulk15N]|uniref:Uncharacterized protein n=1 Tax=Candidatus Synechococcus spongiarum LMB bulk15N TaxID=1943583 RepID=A0A1T1D2S3_9SYNE|nr:hypothetical protein BV53_04755 [Candidatus Synechococcus spongiarum LMB bulk15N]